MKIMKYNREIYIGKEIQLYPGDTYKKYGIIENVDDLGWIIKITDTEDCNSRYKIGDRIFISNSEAFFFRFLED